MFRKWRKDERENEKKISTNSNSSDIHFVYRNWHLTGRTYRSAFESNEDMFGVYWNWVRCMIIFLYKDMEE